MRKGKAGAPPPTAAPAIHPSSGEVEWNVWLPATPVPPATQTRARDASSSSSPPPYPIRLLEALEPPLNPTTHCATAHSSHALIPVPTQLT